MCGMKRRRLEGKGEEESHGIMNAFFFFSLFLLAEDMCDMTMYHTAPQCGLQTAQKRKGEEKSRETDRIDTDR